MALTLTRKEGESIHIGDDITITISKLDMGRARVSIDAPRHIEIRRAELPKRTTEEAKAAGVPF